MPSVLVDMVLTLPCPDEVNWTGASIWGFLGAHHQGLVLALIGMIPAVLYGVQSNVLFGHLTRTDNRHTILAFGKVFFSTVLFLRYRSGDRFPGRPPCARAAEVIGPLAAPLVKTVRYGLNAAAPARPKAAILSIPFPTIQPRSGVYLSKRWCYGGAMNRAILARINNSPYLLLTLAVLFWSGNFVLGRAVRADVPPIGLAFWRWAIAALLVLCPALPSLRQDWSTIREHCFIILLLSALGVAVFNTLVYIGLQYTIALNAFLMQTMMPVLIVGMSFVLFRDRVRPLQGAGIVFALIGAVTIIVQGSPQALRTLTFNPGDIVIFTAVIAYAGYSVLLRQRPPMHPLSFVAITFIIGAIMLLPFYVWETLEGRPVRWETVTVAAVAYVAVFPSIISFLCFNRGVELIGANRAGLFLYLMPLFGGFMAVVFLGERLAWFHGAGMLFIVAGIFLAVRGR